jgi:hypothetical protein
MNGPQKITLAAEEAADPNALDGVRKIMAAAGEAGCKPPGYDAEAVRKILAAASQATATSSNGSDALRKITAAMAEAKTHDADDGVDRIRRAAGKPGRAEEEFAKSLSRLDELEGTLRRPVPPAQIVRQWVPKSSRFAKAFEDRKFATIPASRHRPPPESTHFRWATDSMPLHEAGHRYYEFRDRLAGDLRTGALGSSPAGMVDHATRHFGMNIADAAEWTERFLADLVRFGTRMAAKQSQTAA